MIYNNIEIKTNIFIKTAVRFYISSSINRLIILYSYNIIFNDRNLSLRSFIRQNLNVDIFFPKVWGKSQKKSGERWNLHLNFSQAIFQKTFSIPNIGEQSIIVCISNFLYYHFAILLVSVSNHRGGLQLGLPIYSYLTFQTVLTTEYYEVTNHGKI